MNANAGINGPILRMGLKKFTIVKFAQSVAVKR
jgi:hypothetical protein